MSSSGDQGADPNHLVVITDRLKATTLPADEHFAMLRTARYGEVLRGVSFTPGTEMRSCGDDQGDDRHSEAQGCDKDHDHH